MSKRCDLFVENVLLRFQLSNLIFIDADYCVVLCGEHTFDQLLDLAVDLGNLRRHVLLLRA